MCIVKKFFYYKNMLAPGMVKPKRKYSTVFLIVMILTLAVSLTSCSNKDAKNGNSKEKNAKKTEAVTNQSDSNEASDNKDRTNNNSSEKKNAKDKDKSKTSDKKSSSSSSSSNSSNSSSTAPAKQKVWVPATGHYETIMVIKCNCGQEFATPQAQKDHQEAYLAEMRKTDPNFQCQGKHLARKVPKQVWKEDTPGHYEYR